MGFLATVLRAARSLRPSREAAPAREQAACSRRDFLRGNFLRPTANLVTRPTLDRVAAFTALAEPPRASAASKPPAPVLRPPGSVAEADFLAGCTKCAACVPACPHQAIRLAPPSSSPALHAIAGTPIIAAADAPCLLCPDRPCAAVCAPQVIRATAPAAMGSARIAVLDCLAHQGTTCTTCGERCPVPGAITLERGRPRIDLALCTGCGVCAHVCPAPRPAVIITPNRDRR